MAVKVVADEAVVVAPKAESEENEKDRVRSEEAVEADGRNGHRHRLVSTGKISTVGATG